MGGGSGKGGKGAPSAPNFTAIANAQGNISQDLLREQTFANRPDQYGPFGSTTWEYDPGTPAQPASAGLAPQAGTGGIFDHIVNGPARDALSAAGTDAIPGRWTQHSNLAPELQSAADVLMGGLSNQLDPTASRDSAIDSAYRMSTSRLDPQFQQRRSSLENQLANEGFTRGDAGWQTAMGNFGRDQNDAYQQALYGAQSGAGNTAFAQSLAANMQPYQQLGAIKALGAPQGFTPAGMGDAPNLLAAAMNQYGANMDQYNAGQAGKNSKLSSAGTLALLAGTGGASGGLKPVPY